MGLSQRSWLGQLLKVTTSSTSIRYLSHFVETESGHWFFVSGPSREELVFHNRVCSGSHLGGLSMEYAEVVEGEGVIGEGKW